MSDKCNLCDGSGVVAVNQKCICAYEQSSLAAMAGSASDVKLQKLFEEARKSPIYYLEGLDIECGETLIRLKANLNRTAYYNHEKQQYIKGQIQATRKHLREIRKVMCECEKMPNDQAQRPEAVNNQPWKSEIPRRMAAEFDY